MRGTGRAKGGVLPEHCVSPKLVWQQTARFPRRTIVALTDTSRLAAVNRLGLL